MLQLNPREYFTIARGLENHLDSTTYYVRAVIRNAKTDAVIETVDLVDNGNRRFTYNWQVPADPSGLGFYVLITSTIYSDSGYTTKAENYGEKFETYLIAERDNPLLYPGPGGADISYKKIREIVKDELDKLSFPQPKEVDFSPLSDSLQAILSELRAIDIPAPEKVTFTPLMARFEALEKAIKKAVQDKEVTPKTDLTPVLEAIDILKANIEPYTNKASQEATALLDRIKEFFTGDLDKINNSIEDLGAEFRNRVFLAIKPPKDQSVQQGPKEEPIDYEALLNE